jgi:hypothetical protein
LVGSLNKVTISASGQIIGPVFLYFQETGGTFGPRVLESLEDHPNVYLVCPQSGKLTKNIFKKWCELLYPVYKRIPFSWRTHGLVKVIRTYLIRFSRINSKQWPFLPKQLGKSSHWMCFSLASGKSFIARPAITLNCMIWTSKSRPEIILLECTLLYITKFPALYWYYDKIRLSKMIKSGYFDEDPEPFQSVTQMCFKLKQAHCSRAECPNYGFVCCSLYRDILYFCHFFNDRHFH